MKMKKSVIRPEQREKKKVQQRKLRLEKKKTNNINNSNKGIATNYQQTKARGI